MRQARGLRALAVRSNEVAVIARTKATAAPLVDGFARINIDGHFPRRGVAATGLQHTAEAILDFLVSPGGPAGLTFTGPANSLRIHDISLTFL